jgi:hypothetical protein
VNEAGKAVAHVRDLGAAVAERALKNLHPEDRELVLSVMDNHPGLPVEEAIELLDYFDGLRRLTSEPADSDGP